MMLLSGPIAHSMSIIRFIEGFRADLTIRVVFKRHVRCAMSIGDYPVESQGASSPKECLYERIKGFIQKAQESPH